jgi:hypothetical protein
VLVDWWAAAFAIRAIPTLMAFRDGILVFEQAGALPDAPQDIALVASVPLSTEAWTPLPEGTLVVLREGRVVSTVSA